MKGQLLAALGIVISAGSLISAPAHAGTPIACGITQHDIANTLRVTNTTTSTFTKDKLVNWTSKNIITGQLITGSFTLQSDLAPGQSAFTSIDKNTSASCTATVASAFLPKRH